MPPVETWGLLPLRIRETEAPSAECIYCAQAAPWELRPGASAEWVPMCSRHAVMMLQAVTTIVAQV